MVTVAVVVRSPTESPPDFFSFSSPSIASAVKEQVPPPFPQEEYIEGGKKRKHGKERKRRRQRRRRREKCSKYAIKVPKDGVTQRRSERQEANKGGGSTNVKAVLKHEHLQNLAVWASGESSIPSLASFFGHRLAADGEASAIPQDPSFFPCQRCETILQPGFNCTVRIERNRTNTRHRHKKPHISTQNTVVYNCHFCLHRNLKRGTPKGHMKEMYPPKSKTSSISKVVKSRILKPIISSDKEKSKDNEIIVTSSPAMAAAENPSTDGSVTPVRGRTLLDLKKRNRKKSGSKRPAEPENNLMTPDAEKSVGASSKRRKSWMSLREIVGSNEDNRF